MVDIQLSRKKVVTHAVELRDALSKRGATIVHAPLLYEDGYPEIPTPRGLQKNIVAKGLFARGTEGAVHAGARAAARRDRGEGPHRRERVLGQ